MAKSKYAMSESQVEALAGDYANASDAAGRLGMTYLRVLVSACQAILGTSPKRRTRIPIPEQAQVVGDVAGKYYAAVLRGVTTPDIVPDDTLPQEEQSARSRERNRRSTFARSAKSTLLAYIRAGGDMRALEVESVARDALGAFVRKQRGQSETRFRIERHIAAVVRAATAEAKDKPTVAKADLEHAIEALQFALDGLVPNGNRADIGERVESRDPSITATMRRWPVHQRQPAPAGRAHA